MVVSLVSVYSMSGQVIRTIASTSGNNMVHYIQIYEYNSVDRRPSFPGGNIEMMKFINRERNYPVEAYENGIEGRVVCGFVVNTDGHISDVVVMRGVEESLDREAVRIVTSMPVWTAGYVSDSPVPVFCVVTIPFRR